MADTAIFDVDGTLVDSNYQHALAWHRAFHRFGLTRPLWRIHQGIGMGGDQFVGEVGGALVERTHGDDLRAAWIEEFDGLIGEVAPLESAHELLAEVRRRGFRVVLASSGVSRHVEHFLDLIEARDVIDGWTTSDDADHSKPAPDLVQVALDRVGGTAGVMVGDSPWDARAAAAAGTPTIGVLTGGFGEHQLREAGALRVEESPTTLLQSLDDTPLAEAG